MSAYYNEFDPFAAAWLRELVKAGHIAPGDVDERSITDVDPDDLLGYSQCHFFSGIGGWSLALRLAGWEDDRPVWTGSCPCQPFSVAGKAETVGDERHLWPAFLRLIAERRPATVLGEQVASAAGREWLSGVRLDMEGVGYAVGAADLCAAGVSAPHIRQRLYWVAFSGQSGRGEREPDLQTRESDPRGGVSDGGLAHTQHAFGRSFDGPGEDGRDGAHAGRPEAHGESGARREVRGLAHATLGGLGADGGAPGHAGHAEQREQTGGVADGIGAGLEGHAGHGRDGHEPGRVGTLPAGPVAESGDAGGMAHAPNDECGGRSAPDADAGHRNDGPSGQEERHHGGPEPERRSDAGFWVNAVWLPCRDGKARRVEPGIFPLVAGLPDGMVPGRDTCSPEYADATAEARVGRLRGYGNAICAPLASEFVAASMEAIR